MADTTTYDEEEITHLAKMIANTIKPSVIRLYVEMEDLDVFWHKAFARAQILQSAYLIDTHRSQLGL